MSRAVWVLHLPEKAEIKVESGQQIQKDDLLAQSKEKEFKSPTKAEVGKVEARKIKLKFPAIKIEGKGYGKDSVWGKLVIHNQLSLPEISSDLAGELIFVNKLSNLVLKKGAVVGIKGFVTFQREEKVNSLEVPVLEINKGNKSKIENNEGENCLLYPSKNCLLIPNNEN